MRSGGGGRGHCFGVMASYSVTQWGIKITVDRTGQVVLFEGIRESLGRRDGISGGRLAINQPIHSSSTMIRPSTGSLLVPYSPHLPPLFRLIHAGQNESPVTVSPTSWVYLILPHPPVLLLLPAP